MKIIVLSGGCGVGKRTIGEVLSKQLSFPLIHNHLTANIVREMYGKPSPGLRAPADLLRALRGVIIKDAVSSDFAGLVMTHANHLQTDHYLTWLKQFCNELGVGLSFVNLVCDERVRKERFLSKERGGLGKPFDLDTFQDIEENWGPPSLIDPELETVGTYDISDLSPDEAAQIILSAINPPSS